MSKYEYNKKYAEKWDKENIHPIKVTLKIKEFEMLEEYCKKNNISKTNLIKQRINDIINPK